MKKVKILNSLIVLAMSLSLFAGCKAEKFLSEEFDATILNGPIGIAIVPGADLAIVASSNYNLDYRNGALSVLDLATNKVLSDLTLEIPNFSGLVFIDTTNGKIYVPNRLNNTLIVFDYVVPGAGADPISITEPTLANSIEGFTNQIMMEDNPFGVVLVAPAGIDSKVLVTNIESGDVNVLLAADLSVVDADPDDEDSKGIPLMSLPSLGILTVNDGVGANRLAPSTDGRLIFVTSTLSNYIFIIDTFDNKVEGVLDMSKYAAGGAGMRGIVVASDNKLYVAHTSLEGIIVLDVSGIADNGINNEVILETFLDFIPTGLGPEGIALNVGETKLYVTNEDEASVSVIDLATMLVSATIYTDRGPTEIAVHPTNDNIYVTNFLSNSVSIIDTTTDTLAGVIE